MGGTLLPSSKHATRGRVVVRRTCVGRLSPRCAAMKVVSSRTAASDVGFAAFVDGA